MNLPEKNKLSLNQLKITEASHSIRICDFKNVRELVVEVQGVFENARIDLRISDEFTLEDSIRFTEYLSTYYSGLTIADLKVAFEFYVVGRLEKFLPKNAKGHSYVDHYGKLSVDFMAKVLNAYKSLKQHETVSLPVSHQLEDKSEEVKKRKAEIEFGKYIIDCWEGKDKFCYTDYEFQYLVSIGVVESHFEITPDDLEQAKASYFEKSTKKTISDVRAVLAAVTDGARQDLFYHAVKEKRRKLINQAINNAEINIRKSIKQYIDGKISNSN